MTDFFMISDISFSVVFREGEDQTTQSLSSSFSDQTSLSRTESPTRSQLLRHRALQPRRSLLRSDSVDANQLFVIVRSPLVCFLLACGTTLCFGRTQLGPIPYVLLRLLTFLPHLTRLAQEIASEDHH